MLGHIGERGDGIVNNAILQEAHDCGAAVAIALSAKVCTSNQRDHIGLEGDRYLNFAPGDE